MINDVKKLKSKFSSQKNNAKKRGIGWNLTFDEWLKWWGDDINNRGSGYDKLQMQRIMDLGNYEIGNIIKGYPKQNRKTYSSMHKKRKADKAKKEHEEFLNSLMWMASSPDKEDYLSEYEIEMKESHAVFTAFKADRV